MQGTERFEGNRNTVTQKPLPPGVRVERDVGVVLRDGVRLSVNVFRPTAPGRYPAIMAISPYGKDDFDGYRIFAGFPGSDTGRIDISDHVAFEAPDPGHWAPLGYAVIQADVRGQGQSGGDTNTLSEQEQSDYQELIAWAAAQPWCDGGVALHGVSYLAITQWFVAQHRPPALKAIVPWEGWTEPYGRAYFGGIPEVGFRAFVFQGQIAPAHNPASGFAPVADPADHPLYDEYWRAKSPDLERIDVPALVCASFSDQGLHTRDSFEAYRRIGSREKWLYNHRLPKWHAYYSPEALALQGRFLARFLKGEAHAMDGAPRVRFQVNEQRDVFTVHGADAWPPPGGAARRLWLSSGARLVDNAAGAPESVDYDAQGGEATFRYRFAHDAVLVGNMKLRLWVEAVGGDDMDLFVGVRKFDAEGREIYFNGFSGQNCNDCVARGWLRVSHRALDPARSTEFRPALRHAREARLAPGEVTPVEIEILPSATLFRAGETLALTVQGRPIEPDAPMLKFARLRNAGRHRLHFGARHDAHLLVCAFAPDQLQPAG